LPKSTAATFPCYLNPSLWST